MWHIVGLVVGFVVIGVIILVVWGIACILVELRRG